MLTICLTRIGKKNQPHFRVIVKERSKDPWGKAIELLGHYNPRSKPKTIELKKERILYWLSVGAQPSETVGNILIDQGLLERKKKFKSVTLSKKRREELEKKKVEKAPAKESPVEG